MVTVYLGLGSNIGNKEAYIQKAINALKQQNKIIRASQNYKTDPWGITNQDWFINTAVIIETELTVIELLQTTQKIEQNLGRIKELKNGPRTIDIDILFYADKIVKNDNLEIPHPGVHQRATVLVPLCEIAPDFIHPKLKKTIRELCKENQKLKKWQLYIESNEKPLN